MRDKQQILDMNEAIAESGLQRITISRWARRLGIGRKAGTCWVFTPAELDQIRSAAPGKRGNPDGFRVANEKKAKLSTS